MSKTKTLPDNFDDLDKQWYKTNSMTHTTTTTNKLLKQENHPKKKPSK